MSEALYRKWRPKLWDEVVGQDHIVQTIRNAIRSDRIGHAYLFSGPRGTGKTTTARLLAKAANCLEKDSNKRPCNKCEHCESVNNNRFMDLIEIDAASNTSVDDIRDLREKIGFSPSQGQYKVYIIDEVHMLSTAAFNALLKTLEEPPAHAIFILATTEVHKIPATVLSRCQRHEFRRIPVNTIVSLLKGIVKKEKIKIDDETLTLIARQSTGALRDAISLLDQLASTGEVITLDRAQEVLGTATNQSVIELVGAILVKDAAAGMSCLHQALDSGSDPRQFARQIVEYLRGLMLLQMEKGDLIDVTNEIRLVMSKHAGQFDLSALMDAIRLFNTAANESRLAFQPSLALELAFAQTIQEPKEFSSVEEVNEKPIHRETSQKRELNASEKESIESVFSKKNVESEKKSDVSKVEVDDSFSLDDPQDKQIGDTALSIIKVREAVPEVRTLIRKYRKYTEALLASARSYNLKKGFIVIGFQSPVLKEQFEKGEHLDIIQRAFSHVLGVETKIRAVVINAKDQTDDQIMDFESGGLVSAALDLGGKLVDKE
ncbi:MAG: DNA polymerase III subunit gamma/tau [Chloroflexi bacterium HGW-Chloroflexi-8]|jgi:DNA polymerase-3 subunit gamma/tau|nr:MAG: DNA polymerase III subunit gamma/tau [Chloroflexi bacterium HGW-Chloroflexi-8]